MTRDLEALYHQRHRRYTAAMRLGVPDAVPIRPFAAEFTAAHTGLTCQQVTHDYRLAFDAVIRCCNDYDWDAAVPNMVYVWTGLTHAAGLKYYAVPGLDIPADVAFQYREPAEDNAWMHREDYDEFIENPEAFLWNTWLPRVSRSFDNGSSSRAIATSAWAMADYFTAFGPQIERMKRETATVSAISGMLKAPLDVLADKFRGYLGLAFDLKECPDKVMAACRALEPYLAAVALGGLDPAREIPIPIWMHRGCVPFISYKEFEEIYWATLKPTVDAIIARGNQVLFYAEGKWDAHLEAFAQLPKGGIVFHLDRTNPAKAQEILGGHFALSGGVPNALLAFGSPAEVEDKCKELIDLLGREGGYIMDASAIMQNDARPENVRAMTDFTRRYGVYRDTRDSIIELPPAAVPAAPPEDPFQRIEAEMNGRASAYIWHLVLSF
jgi:hypothetical protein